MIAPMTSLYDYRAAVKLKNDDVPFYALIMAAMMRADSDNFLKLSYLWPEIQAEVQKRWDAPGGVIEGDRIP